MLEKRFVYNFGDLFKLLHISALLMIASSNFIHYFIWNHKTHYGLKQQNVFNHWLEF